MNKSIDVENKVGSGKLDLSVILEYIFREKDWGKIKMERGERPMS